MKQFRFFSLLIVALSFQLMVKANGDGDKLHRDSTIQGTILDADSKKPIGEVTVVITLNNKQQTRKELKSDASGVFTVSKIPPGEFSISIEKKGYKSYRKDFVMGKDNLLIKFNLDSEKEDEEKEEEDKGDTWNPLRVLYGK